MGCAVSDIVTEIIGLWNVFYVGGSQSNAAGVLRVMLLEILALWDAMFCQCLHGSPCFEGPCSPPVHCQTVKEQMSCLTMQQKTLTVLWNTCNHLLNNTVP
jgi:hypothetical protein